MRSRDDYGHISWAEIESEPSLSTRDVWTGHYKGVRYEINNFSYGEGDKKDKIREEILAALKVAEKVQKPALEELVSDVYDTPIPALQKQYEELKEHIKQHPDAYPITAGRVK